MRCILIVLFILLLNICHPSNVKAQHRWDAAATYYPGFLIGHTAEAQNLEAHVHGFELAIKRINNTDKHWNKFYKKAEIGYNFIYMDLGQPSITGKAYALGANFQFKIAGKDQHFLALKLGTGIGYLNKKFDINTNRKNMAIGSNWNGSIQIALIYKTMITKNLSLNTGGGITHFSNGSLKTPNLGVNMPTLFLGLQRSFATKSTYSMDSNSLFTATSKRHEILINYAYKERFISDPRQFHIFSLGYRKLKNISPVRRWYYGSDLVWDPTHPYSHFLNKSEPRVGIDNSTELTLLFGHRYDIGRFAMITDIGFYILNPYFTKYFTYQRVGFRYELNKDWFLNAALKIHFGTADYFEWGIGYKFDKRKR
jgi:hypothetical protein